MGLAAKTEDMQNLQKETAYQFFRYLMENPYSEEKKKDDSEDDKKFRKKTSEEIADRDEQYTNLLKHFVCLTRIRNYIKEFFKWTFYLTVIICMFGVGIVTYSLFKKYLSSASIDQITEAIPLLLTSLGGFISIVIVIPTTITKYLFSTEEDKNITEIISHTQNHDLNGRQWVTEFLKFTNKKNDDSESKKAELLKEIEKTG